MTHQPPDPADPHTRYQRQALLPQIGPAGQMKLAESRVLLVGCGALGCTIADQLARAGVGELRVADRDIVEAGNLHRQVLFDEQDARSGAPKAVAAAQRLARINSSIRVVPLTLDVQSDNVEQLLGGEAPPHVILDGTDNAETRYLINDASIRHGIPWVYGACVGTEGRVMVIRPGGPGATACLRCIYPQPPGPGELPTCDTAGVLGPAAAVVGAVQAAAAIRLLVSGDDVGQLLTLDVWTGHFRAVSLDGARRPDCPACGLRRLEFLDRPLSSTTSLCGRDAVQVRPADATTSIDPQRLAQRLARAGVVQSTPHFFRFSPEPSITMTVFPDGRALVQGTTDPARARSLYARFVGA